LKEWFSRWLYGDDELLEGISDAAPVPDSSREDLKKKRRESRRSKLELDNAGSVIRAEEKGFFAFYRMVAVASCMVLIGVLLYTVANLPRYGEENPRTVEVVKRYIEQGVEETGAINIVSGMILDYRAFDTLGESHVLFTALVCVLILLKLDKKTVRGGHLDSYYTIKEDRFFDISKDPILRLVGTILVPCIILFGIYVLLNGQNGPGGGFSAGAILGAALIVFSEALGFEAVDRVFSARVRSLTIFVSLAFYSLAKGYVFFTGANGLENHIPKGTPGAILSGGLILPLNIAVGLVVACTMYGFFSLFKRAE